MQGRKSGWSFVGLLSLALVPHFSSPPARAEQKAPQTFSGSTDVVAVEIPVQVLRDGEPVRGLRASDFEVFDGKTKQEITGFEVLDLGDAETAPAAGAATRVPQMPVAGRRHFLMLFDLTFSEPRSIVRARLAAKQLLKQLHPADLLGVATYSTLQGPQLVLGFTPDRRQAEVAIETLGLPRLIERGGDPLRFALSGVNGPGRSTARPQTNVRAPGADAMVPMEESLVDTFDDYSAASTRADRAQQAELIQRLTGSFSQLARLMSTVDGRKYVVLLSQGYDATLLTGTVDLERQRQMQNDAVSGRGTFTDNSNERFGDTKSTNRVEKMLEEFRRADCIVEAVDISGLRAEGDQGPRLASGKDSLLQIAKDTGGEFFENFNDLNAAMGKMLKNTSVTYVLSIQPENLKPGDYRRLKVELKDAPRGTRVVYRQGYYAPKSYAQQDPLEKLLETSSELLGQEHGGVQISVLAAPFKIADGPGYVPVVVEVDGPSLLAGKQALQLPVEVFIYALDENGGVAGFIAQTYGLEMAKAEPVLRQGGFKFLGHFDLDSGRYELRVLIRNGATGVSGLRVAQLDVPAFGPGPVLLPAFFPDASNRWLMARETPKADARPVAYPFLRQDEAFIPSSLPVLKPGAETPVALVGYNLAAGTWKAQVRILASDGREFRSAGLKLKSAAPGVGGQAAHAEGSFTAPDLPPGEYLLKVTLTDGAGASGSSLARFALAANPPPSGSPAK